MHKSYGDPVLTVRLPAWQISGLKICARKNDESVSILLRRQIADYLRENGITETIKVIDGQTKMDV